MKEKIRTHRDLEVFARAFDAAMKLFELSKQFPAEERYSLTDQMRRSSRSVCANIAEAWRKRRYRASFISKLCDVESEAAEVQVWIEFAVKCGYLSREPATEVYRAYDQVIRTIVGMVRHPEPWIIDPPK